MRNREILESVVRLEEIEDTAIMRELYPDLSWYWDKVDDLLEANAAFADCIDRRLFDHD